MSALGKAGDIHSSSLAAKEFMTADASAETPVFHLRLHAIEAEEWPHITTPLVIPRGSSEYGDIQSMRTTPLVIDPRRKDVPVAEPAMLGIGAHEGAIDSSALSSARNHLQAIGSWATQGPAKGDALLTTRGASGRIIRFGYEPDWRVRSFHIGLWKCPTITWVRDLMRAPLRGANSSRLGCHFYSSR